MTGRGLMEFGEFLFLCGAFIAFGVCMMLGALLGLGLYATLTKKS